MSISGTITLLQTLHAAVSGVSSAPADPPTPQALGETGFNLDSGAVILTVDGSGTWEKVAGKTYQRRTYQVSVFLTYGNETQRPLALTRMKALKQLLGELYTDPANRVLSPTQAQPTAGGVEIESTDPEGIRDSELRTLKYLEKLYYGFQVQLTVTEFER